MPDFLCDRCLPQQGFLLLNPDPFSLAGEASFLDYTINGWETGSVLYWVRRVRDRLVDC